MMCSGGIARDNGLTCICCTHFGLVNLMLNYQMLLNLGLLQSRFRTLTPKPQVWLHVDQVVHPDHPPSMGAGWNIPLGKHCPLMHH